VRYGGAAVALQTRAGQVVELDGSLRHR
jgi:hypothetical protein